MSNHTSIMSMPKSLCRIIELVTSMPHMVYRLKTIEEISFPVTFLITVQRNMTGTFRPSLRVIYTFSSIVGLSLSIM